MATTTSSDKSYFARLIGAIQVTVTRHFNMLRKDEVITKGGTLKAGKSSIVLVNEEKATPLTKVQDYSLLMRVLETTEKMVEKARASGAIHQGRPKVAPVAPAKAVKAVKPKETPVAKAPKVKAKKAPKVVVAPVVEAPAETAVEAPASEAQA